MTDDDVTCKQFAELVTAYLEQALDPRERLLVEAHLAACGGCRIYLDQMRRTVHLLASLPKESTSPEARQDLIDAFRAWKRSQMR